jgi:hypothetical protein
METIRLNHLNNAFRLEGSEKRRNLELYSVSVQEWPAGEATLKLVVVDEKDVPIYSQPLAPSQQNEEISIGKTFGFYDHLSVQLRAEPDGSPFEALVHFK